MVVVLHRVVFKTVKYSKLSLLASGRDGPFETDLQHRAQQAPNDVQHSGLLKCQQIPFLLSLLHLEYDPVITLAPSLEKPTTLYAKLMISYILGNCLDY